MGEYKIKDIEVLTGIKAHTLRMWEKRYGILTPERTDTKIRNYSDADLVTILNIAVLNKNGMKISHIAEMSEEKICSEVAELNQNAPDNDIVFENLLLALLQMDERLFNSSLNKLIEEHGVTDTFSIYLTAFLDRIGVMWLTGTIHAGQEHFISNLIRQRVIAEIDQLPVPAAKGNTVLLFLPEFEWHELSLLFYHYALRKNGIYSFYLGQSTPTSSLITCVEKLEPKALITSCLTAVDEQYIRAYFQKIKEKLPNTLIYAGGNQIKAHEGLLGDLLVSVQSKDDLCELIRAI